MHPAAPALLVSLGLGLVTCASALAAPAAGAGGTGSRAVSSTRPLVRHGRDVLLVGLTGGVASGKSTVGRILGELGARVVDADALARQVVEPGRAAYRDLVREFGRDIVAADRQLDRKKLGAIVFADPAKRQRLNEITHPRIHRAAQRAIGGAFRAGARVVVYEVPLLVENRLQEQLDKVIVVSVPPEVQLRRLIERDGFDVKAAQARIASQLPLAQRLAVADYVIDNSGSPAETRAQVERLWTTLQQAR